MGLLRLILALNVVIAHAGGNLFKITSVGGMIAVETFFIISGFYMTLILTQKYTGEGSYKLFISNRWLRLFPLYYAVTLITILVYFISYKICGQGFNFEFWVKNLHSLNPFSLLFIIFTNIFVIGQDLVNFLTLNPNGSLIFTKNFLSAPTQLYQFLFVGQAWTMSLEFLFYFMAPFIIKLKNRYIIGAILLSLISRFAAYHFGFGFDPWLYRFFPFEIAFFLLGIIAYRIYERIKDLNISKKLLNLLLFVTVLISIIYQYIPIVDNYKKFACFALLFSVIPFLFKATKNNKFDRYIGELSYPVYICHILVIHITSLFFAEHKPAYYCLITIVISIGLSVLLNEIIAKPIEQFRQNRSKKSPTDNSIENLELASEVS